MKQEDFELLAIDYLRGTLSGDEKKAFEQLLTQSDQVRQFKDIKAVWKKMDTVDIPEPSHQMDVDFFSALYTEIEQQEKQPVTLKTFLNTLGAFLIKPQLAYGLLFLVLVGGYFFNLNDSKSEISQKEVVDSETEQVREKLVLTLLEQNSANRRLEGVSEANKIGRVDDRVVDALLRTLNNDPNVNVRLAAIESLTNYVENPKVRQGLIQSIPNQESPIIQVTLANLMLALEEKRSIELFKQLLKKPEL
ncbi:MAG: HEAT repeat domain-containing protein, partial [Croceivirga sp.]